jgi:hypothetical protein
MSTKLEDDNIHLVFKKLHPNQDLKDISLLDIYEYTDMIIKLDLPLKTITSEETLYLQWLYTEYIHYIFSV